MRFVTRVPPTLLWRKSPPTRQRRELRTEADRRRFDAGLTVCSDPKIRFRVSSDSEEDKRNSMRLMRFLLRLFGFVQWLAAVVIGALCVFVHVEILKEAIDGTAVGSGTDLATDLATAFGPTVLSVHQTLPGLLVSVLLLLSAIYCDRAGKASARPAHRKTRPSSETGPPGDAQATSPGGRVD